MATFPLILRHAQEAVRAARAQARIALDVGTVDPHPNDARMALPGDPWRLRGIPVIGVHGGAGGEIRGSRPDAM